jgi:hypothetical protein
MTPNPPTAAHKEDAWPLFRSRWKLLFQIS